MSSAQISLEIDTINTKVIESSDIVAHNFFTNDLPQQKNFRWTRKEIEMTNGWETAICDNNQCYLPRISSMEILMGPNVTSILDLHLYPNEIYEGYAAFEILLEHVNDSTINETALFFFDSQFTSSNQELTAVNFEVYPNPSNGLFNVKNNEEQISAIRILDIAGHQIQHLTIGNRELINLTHLPTGTYMMQLLDAEGKKIETKMISKH